MSWAGHPVVILLARALAPKQQARAEAFLAAFATELGLADDRTGRLWLAQAAAQMAHESDGWTLMLESLTYTTPGRLRETWPSRFAAMTDAELAPLLRAPRALASAVYAGRMGNRSAADAYEFRGRGPVQLTGRANYTAAGAALGLDLVAHPDLAARDDVSGRVAAWFVRTRIMPRVADPMATRAVRRAWNGGSIGLEDVRARLERGLHQLQSAGLV
jgi:putative chitinase